jgi:hypothetical protein
MSNCSSHCPSTPAFSHAAALYVAKDHSLTREVIPGLLKYWPFGNSQKQIMFINELEDLFEYVQVRCLLQYDGVCYPIAFRRRLVQARLLRRYAR